MAKDAKETDFVDNNIAVVANQKNDDGELLIKLNKNLTGLNSATYTTTTGEGDEKTSSTTVVDGTGLKITDGPSITKTGVDAGSKQVKNTASGLNGQMYDTKVDGQENWNNAANIGDVKNIAGQTSTDLTAKGLDFVGNDNVKVHRDLGTTLTIQGEGTKDDANYSGENLKVVGNKEDGSLTIKMDKDITSDSVTVGKDGKDGTNGVDGKLIIKNGKDGKDGADAGIHVIKGDPGVNGKDGETITRVVYNDGKDGKDGKDYTLATTEDGQKYAGNFGAGAAVKLNKTVTVRGELAKDAKETDFVDNNIAVVANQKNDDGELLIKLNKNLTGLNSATYTTTTGEGDEKTSSTTVVDGTGLKITDGPSITKTGIDAGSKQITNTASGRDGNMYDTTIQGQENWNNAANIGDVTNIAKDAADAVKAQSGKNIIVDSNNKVNLNDHITMGDVTNKAQQVDIDGNAATITAGDGENKVTINGSNGTITAGDKVSLDGKNGVGTIGGVKIGNQTVTTNLEGDKAKSETGNFVTGLDNKTWDPENNGFVSGRGATEDQLHQVETNTNKKFEEVNTKIDAVDKHHTEVTVNGGTAAGTNGAYSGGNLQLNEKQGTDGQKIYDLKLNDNLNIGGAGKDGKDGTNGHIGINGADGKSGVGIDGKDGISIKGADGKAGVTITGKDGANGTEGHIGLTGAAGKDGKNAAADIQVISGQVGVDGTDGNGGKDGMDRISYTDHNNKPHEVATTDDGMKFAGDSGEALQQKLNSTTNIKGGATGELSEGNIGVVSDGKDTLTVKLAKDIKGLDSIETTTVNATTVNSSSFNIAGDDSHDAITIKQGDVNMGGNTISGVAPGKVSQDSTEAVNGSQLWQRDQAINGLSGSVNKLGNRINRVGAGAAALAALHPLDFDPDDKWDFAAGYGNYRGANAAAVGAYYRPNEDTMFSVGGSFGGGENMVNAGVSIKLGQGNHVSTSRVAMAKEIKDLRQNVVNLNAIVNRQSALIDKLTGTNAGMIKDKGNDLFPDVPANHWAYEYVTKLKHAGILTGYPDGNFDGDRMMTRYEFAAIVYRAIMAGAASNPALNQDGTLDKLANEFSSEMKYIRIDTIAKDKNGKPTIERVRVISDAK